MMKPPSYVVVTPVRNEEKFLSCTIDSIAAQTIRPLQWIIVDDGSTDNTANIAKAAAKEHPWIQIVQRPDRGSRNQGGGVVEAFYDGYHFVEAENWEFLIKLDGDLSFRADYIEKCLLRFRRDSKLGIGGGTICRMWKDVLMPEAPGDPAFHVRGATKIYKRDCWEAIAGVIPAPGWDTVDEYKANMLGWSTYTFPELKIRHHRSAGDAVGTWKNWVKNGLANYVAGYHPLFMTCKCGKRAFSKPYGIGALGLLVGFASGYLRRVSQVNDPQLIRYVRNQQLRKLCFRDSLWDRTPL
jgi:biofilm PGA synthesis N-glycosyltransferase PgaC